MMRVLVAVSLAFAVACGSSGNNTNDGGVGSDAVSDVAVDAPPLGDPITGLTPGAWTWVDFPGAKCRDGTATGIGINPGTASKVMIFLEGGGACFNATTCGANPAHFDATTFATQFKPLESLAGIFSRADTSNPVRDWSMVYVPYCTGDIHAGRAPDAQVPGVLGNQQFVGYGNIEQYLSRLVPTFAGATQVLLTGQSAGGFGAALNYVHVARTFGSVPVDLLDDSGPLMSNPYLAACLEQAQTQLFGFAQTIVTDCGADCNDTGNDLALYWKHLPKAYPSRQFGFVDSSSDSVIAGFFGFGAANCSSFVALSPATYEAGLLDMRTQVATYPNAGLFIYPGVDHTSMVAAFTTRTATAGDGGTVSLEAWTSALVSGSVTNVGP